MNKVKKSATKELFSETGVFLVKKGRRIIYDIPHSKDMENLKNMVND